MTLVQRFFDILLRSSSTCAKCRHAALVQSQPSLTDALALDQRQHWQTTNALVVQLWTACYLECPSNRANSFAELIADVTILPPRKRTWAIRHEPELFTGSSKGFRRKGAARWFCCIKSCGRNFSSRRDLRSHESHSGHHPTGLARLQQKKTLRTMRPVYPQASSMPEEPKPHQPNEGEGKRNEVNNMGDEGDQHLFSRC